MVVASIMSEKREGVKVLFVYSSLSTFVRTDLDILRTHFTVKSMKATTFLVPKPGRNPLIFPRLLKEVLWADVVFSWFANLNAVFLVLLSIIFRKKSLIVVGGYDAAYMPEIGYGVFIGRWNRVWVKLVYRYVDKILVVDESLKEDIMKNTGLQIEKKIRTVPTGYDSDKWKPEGEKNERLVITVGNVIRSNLKRKGFETFVKAAKFFPNVKFVLIGKHSDASIDYLKSIASLNVDFPGFVSDRELIRYYQKAKVYCQLSTYEGLPNALCEAMLCECVPLGTRSYGIPTAIGNTGFYVPYGDVETTVEGIRKALSSSLKRGKAARERIKKLFPSQRREKELIYHINELLICK